MTKLTMRNYQSEDDYWRIRAFLREVYLLDDRHEIGWQASRLDYWRWHMVMNVEVVSSLEESIFLWETDDGRIGAVLHADSQNEAILNIHPDFRTAQLADEMLAAAEKNLGTPGKNFFAFAHNLDPLRQDVLRARGYAEAVKNNKESQWRRDLTIPVPDVVLPTGYSVRSIGEIGGEDWPQRSWVSWLAFHPDDPDDAYDPDWRWSLNWSHAPLYRRDLDIVAISPDDEVVAYCVFWYDDMTCTALFDPVAVMPEHQRRGLGRALVTEAMYRAKEMGAILATVGGYEPGPNALYSSALSPDCDINVPWVKKL